MPLTRPNKFLDAAELERWMTANYPQTFGIWEYGETAEHEVLWEWLDREHFEILGEFKLCWRAMEEDARRDAAQRDEARRRDYREC